MKILAIDTSTKYLSVAVADSDKILAEHTKLAERNHAPLIVKTVDALLRKVKLSLRDIGCFALGIGPGSFTGLRIGVAAVKGFAFAAAKPVASVPSYDAIAHNILAQKKTEVDGKEIIIIGDAKKDKIYAAVYKYEKDKLKNISRYLLLKPADFVKMIKSPAIFAGDGIPVYGGLLKKEKRKMHEYLPERLWYPRAGVIAKLGLEKFKKGETINAVKLVPMYLYSKECDITGR